VLIDRIQDKSAIIGVVGLGYVGLPLAVSFAEAGFRVVGIDNQQGKLDILHRGGSYIADVRTDKVKSVSDSGKFQATNWEQVGKVDVAIICVPTPITKDKKPDLSYIKDSVRQIKGRMANPDSMVVLESSTYPGTTRDMVLPILDGSARYVAYSPERVDPGSKRFNITNTPKLVGGIDKESTELATLLYGKVIDKVVPVSSAEVAETAKLYENVFRNVNIALANEMALICEKIGVSVWEVIDAATTKPFGFMPFYPGVGVGGSCIPKDPHYLLDKAKENGYHPTLIEAAITINERQPNQVKHWVIDTLIGLNITAIKAKVLVLGVAFKKDVSDTRDSPSIELINRLHNYGMDVLYNDPYVPRLSERMVSEELDDELLESADCVVIATDHSCYDWKWIVDKAKLVFDTRNATRGIVSEKIYRLGERRE
jgi:UDP-N-acetyl-D-glucosamine dehydrogenase